MCSNYEPIRPSKENWVNTQFGCVLPREEWKPHISYNQSAPFIYLDAGVIKCELARFGLIPHWAKQKATHGKFTYNARSETIDRTDSYRSPWESRNFGIVLAEKFYEPLYDRFGNKSVSAGIYRTDGQPTAIAAIWEKTIDEDNGESIFSFSMVTQNADSHSFMRQFHKPTDEKRSVVVLENFDFQSWLHATHRQARELIHLSPEGLLKTDTVAPYSLDLFD